MPFFLAQRDTDSSERMDDPNCDHAELENTYRQFSTINSMISGWKHIYRKYIKAEFSARNRSYSLLDIGFGGGDIPLKLAKWAADDGIPLNITAIETDPRAVAFVETLNTPDNIQFEHCSSTDLLHRGQQFDVVISNHLLHHLNANQFQNILKESKQLSKKKVIFNDLERSDSAYLLFNVFSRPAFRSSFITHDGLTSIKRSYTLKELKKQAPEDWSVQRLFPFRLLLQYEHVK